MKLWIFRLIILLALIVMLLSVLVPIVPAGAQELDDYLPGEVLVKLARVTDVAGIAADYSLDPIPLDQFGTRAIFRMRILDGAPPLERATQLAGDARVIYAEPNFIGQAPEGLQRISWPKGEAGADSQEQWAAGMIRLPEAHTVTRGAGTTVAVLDTGIDLNHPALAGHLIDGYDFVDMDADPGVMGMPEQNPNNGHGTHVAGLVALVAPEARITMMAMAISGFLRKRWRTRSTPMAISTPRMAQM
jgi:subtilisin family serine protease